MKTKQLPKGWKEVELGDNKYFEIIMGQSPAGETYNEFGKGMPFFQGKREFGKKYPSVKKWTTQPSKLAKPKDILMSVRAPVGSVNICDIDCCIGRGLASIRCKNTISKDYVYNFLKIREKFVESLGSGSTFKAITSKQLRSIKIPLPPLQTQKKIVSILEKAEKLKQKGAKAGELLDEYLKSIFYEMFLKEKYKFEKYQGLDLFEFSYGKGLPKSKRFEEGYNVYGSNGIIGYHKEYLIKGPGIVIGRKGSIGEINFSENNFWPIDTTYYISQKKKFNWIFLYYLLKSTPLKHLNKSAAVPGLNRNDVYSIKFIYPPLPLQQKFAKIVKHIEGLKENVNKTKQNSGELFNSLMSKAFKGELIR